MIALSMAFGGVTPYLCRSASMSLAQSHPQALDPEAGIAKRVELDFQSTRKLDGSILPFAVPPSIRLSVEETPGVLPINWRNQLW
jgi:hypothetical protein